VGQFAPKCHGQFAPKQWVSLRRNGVVSFIIISSLYTKPNQRNKGYAYALVHEIVNQLFEGGYKKCAIISDATHNITNKLFLEVGFREVSKYISVNINPTSK